MRLPYPSLPCHFSLSLTSPSLPYHLSLSPSSPSLLALSIRRSLACTRAKNNCALHVLLHLHLCHCHFLHLCLSPPFSLPFLSLSHVRMHAMKKFSVTMTKFSSFFSSTTTVTFFSLSLYLSSFALSLLSSCDATTATLERGDYFSCLLLSLPRSLVHTCDNMKFHA